jgi:hypothetical protein
VAVGQYEAISICPSGVSWVVVQVPREQRLSHFGHAHRSTRVPRISLLDGIHRQSADSVGQFDRGVVGLAHAMYP